MGKRAWMLLWLAACGDESLSPEQQQLQAERECAERSVAQCAQDDACRTIVGHSLELDVGCRSESKELGCQPAEQICGEALSYAKDPQGKTWKFATTCIPAGFVSTTPSFANDPRCGDIEPNHRPCSLLSVAECKQSASCETIDGRVFDGDKSCIDAEEPVGCQDKGVSCPPAIIYGSDGQRTYELASGCLPLAWSRVEPTELPASSWPSCRPACETLDVAGCKLDARCGVITGLRVDRTQRCLGEAVELACTATGPRICTDALLIGTDAQGHSYWFGGGGDPCVPPDYTYDGADEAVHFTSCNPTPPAPPKACAELRGDDCEVDRSDCIAIHALAYEPEQACVRGMKKVGCMPRTQGCTAAITYGRDAEGQDWRFPSGCQPAGFTAFQPAQTPEPSWPGCTN